MTKNIPSYPPPYIQYILYIPHTIYEYIYAYAAMQYSKLFNGTTRTATPIMRVINLYNYFGI